MNDERELKAVRFSEIEAEPYPDRSEARPADELTWPALVREEPALAVLENDIRAVSDEGGPAFCANAAWCGYGDVRGGFSSEAVSSGGLARSQPEAAFGSGVQHRLRTPVRPATGLPGVLVPMKKSDDEGGEA